MEHNLPGDKKRIRVKADADYHRVEAERMTWQAANLRQKEFPADPRVGSIPVPSTAYEDILAQQRFKELFKE